MNTKRIVNNILSILLLVMFAAIVLAGCPYDSASPQGNQNYSTPSAVTSNPPSAPASSTPAPAQSPFPESSVKPAALPASAKWNDEIDIAIMKYHQEMGRYIEKLKKEDPDWMARSSWEVGQGEGGPLTILTDLGISNLQRLIDRVQWGNPLVVNLEIAICALCRARSSNIGFTEKQVEGWRQEFAINVFVANSEVERIARALQGSPDENYIRNWLARFGILALPEVYELVINQGNTNFIKYLPDILPLDKMKAYNIQAGQTDDETLKEALRSCSEDIKIIQALNVD